MSGRIPKTLPPLVDGNFYGNLTVTIDHILWCKKFTGEVIVLLQWWGDNDSVTFRPSDISSYPESARENNRQEYIIKTNLSLFETYLKKCDKLKLLVINNESKEIVGHVEINNLLEHITGIQVQKYFPIVISSGARIGDLRVDFDLSMNSFSEETPRKTKKRSRRKTKSFNSSFCSTNEEQKTKPLIKDFNSCPDHIKNTNKSPHPENTIDLEIPNPIKINQAPPNTGRSESSEFMLLEVLEKGKKLRDAMVLSVLEDSDVQVDLNEDLILKLDLDHDKESKLSFIACKTNKNGEVITPHEEKLIKNYLEGKIMKEEEEKIALNILYSQNVEQKPKPNLTNGQSDKDINCCPTANAKGPNSAPSHPAISSISTYFNKPIHDEFDIVMKKVNCFRLTVDTLTLTSAGWKKINQALGNKTKKCNNMPPPGATYFVECHFVEETPRTQAQMWKATPLRFCSRRQIKDVVYFGQSSAHSLRPPHTFVQLQSDLESVNCLVCWRHLNQRVPALLGRFSLAGLLDPHTLELTDSLPVIADNVIVVGYIKLKLQLGKDKLYFGNALLDDISRNNQEYTNHPEVCELPLLMNKKFPDIIDQEIYSAPKDISLDVKDLLGESKKETDIIQQDASEKNTKLMVPSLANFVDIPVCKNCGQNLILTKMDNSVDSSLCNSCSNLLGQHQNLIDPYFKISIPKNFASKESRHHEFLIGIDAVKGCSLFANIEEELSCYVDYKFPEITSGLKAEMAKTETTSRVVEVKTQPNFASVHRHSLALPVVLPLSPLLANCSPGVTLRLWLRYFKPTPRDHMVAMALLPMDELCLMELEFDERQQDIAITKVLELPLAFVPSSVTAPYQKCQAAGVLRVSVTYSNFISPPATRLIDNTQPKLKPISELLDRISCQDFETKNEELKLDKNRFWTGPPIKEKEYQNKNLVENKGISNQNTDMLNHKSVLYKSGSPTDPPKVDATRSNTKNSSALPVMKEDLDILAENIEHRFNQLQSELMKEKKCGVTDISSIVTGDRKLTCSLNEEINDDFLQFPSLSSNSSIESLPFILGPPADFEDVQNTVACSKKNTLSDSLSDKSVSETISGFLKDEKEVANCNPNGAFEKNSHKPETVKPRTFKAKVKIDRAVNLKAIKAPCNGKKGKIPPSSSVYFFCTGQRYTTPVIRRNHNPVWNLAWDVDLPVEYLLQEEKRLEFWVSEESHNNCIGSASASVSILKSGLPCLSSWLSIFDTLGTCKGQLKVVITPLEDLRHYQDCSVSDVEEDDFEELKDKKSDNCPENGAIEPTVFVASQTEIFINKSTDEIEFEQPEEVLEATKGEEIVLADDIISDYKNTLENNFRNEMAGLENLIKFLRVGSMTSSELSFFRSTENKENVSSNPTTKNEGEPSSIYTAPESYLNASPLKNGAIHKQNLNCNNQKDRCLIDASTETCDRAGLLTTSQGNSEDILSKLLQQISTFQPSVIKIMDRTSQTLIPETKETFTETSSIDCEEEREANNSIHMKDACTETEDIDVNHSSQSQNNLTSHHVCGELGSVLLQHFLTCKPSAVKVMDSAIQTDNTDSLSTANSSGVFMSGISVDINKDVPPKVTTSIDEWVQADVPTGSQRLIFCDNNIRDLEQVLQQNLVIIEKNVSSPFCSNEESLEVSIDEYEVLSSNENNPLLSDVESLEGMESPRETPDGGNSSVPDTTNQVSSIATEPLLRRRGTFVIEKSLNSEDPKEKK